MNQRQAPYRTTAMFPEPNYTQTPNDFFEMLPDMESSEVRVTLIMIRNTFGYHRESFKMGLGKLADAAGLSRNAAKDGAEAAEKRGTFKRSNPDSLGESEWELVIDQSVTTPQPVTVDSQPVTTTPSTSDLQSGVKEKKERIKKGDLVDAALFFGKQAKEQKADKIEELLQEIERGLKVNITRSTANQNAARRILNDGRPFGQWLTWCISDQWRAARLYHYADVDKIWRDYPQAFENNTGYNPQGLSIS